MRIVGLLREIVKRHSALLAKPMGIQLLSKQQTEAYLKGKELFYRTGEIMTLPKIGGSLPDSRQLFAQKTIMTASTRVWRYENVYGQAKQLPSGILMIGRKVLNADFGNSIAVKDWLTLHSRPVQAAKILIAPWSHYWTGFYDYIFFVALKLCRIKNTLSAAEFEEAVVCYPLFGAAYERDILELLGFTPARILDSRQVNIQFETCLLGSNDSWFYASPDDMRAFKSLMETHLRTHLPQQERQHNRIYIQRTGRRKVLNEDSLLILLQRYDFQIIEDISYTLTEQVFTYYHAAFVIGPHGASFANILWCRPGAHLFELFPSTYMPDYFRYLAQAMDITYSAYCHQEPAGSDHRHVQDDVYVDLEELERYLVAALSVVFPS